jgi:hypothetical protein
LDSCSLSTCAADLWGCSLMTWQSEQSMPFVSSWPWLIYFCHEYPCGYTHCTAFIAVDTIQAIIGCHQEWQCFWYSRVPEFGGGMALH